MARSARPRASRWLAALALLPLALGVLFLLLAVAQHHRAYPSGAGRHATGSDAWVVDLVGAWLLILAAVATAAAVLLTRRGPHDS